MPKFFGCLEFEHFAGAGYVLSGVICKVSGEDEEKSFADGGRGKFRGSESCLYILELGSECFEAVEEVSGSFSVLGPAFHPLNLGVLEEGG